MVHYLNVAGLFVDLLNVMGSARLEIMEEREEDKEEEKRTPKTAATAKVLYPCSDL